MNTPEEQLIWKGHSSQLMNFWWFVSCILVLPIPIAFWKWLQVNNQTYEITSERIKMGRGIFSRRTDELELYRVRDNVLVEPFWYRLFGKGNIILSTTDSSSPTGGTK